MARLRNKTVEREETQTPGAAEACEHLPRAQEEPLSEDAEWQTALAEVICSLETCSPCDTHPAIFRKRCDIIALLRGLALQSEPTDETRRFVCFLQYFLHVPGSR